VGHPPEPAPPQGPHQEGPRPPL
ncbi:hypothetical protein BN1708_018792, partial [Verticillium longisporum]